MTILLNKPVTPCLKTLTKYLSQVNESGWYTNFGPLHQELTYKLEEYLSVKNLLLVNNGTIALHVAYRALNVKNAICTPFSYAATASSLAWEKIPTTFVDIDSNSFNLSPKLIEKKIKSTPSIDSIVATHVYGNPCDVDEFSKLQRQYNLKIIFDGAHAFKVDCGKKSISSYGDASTLSFHATKVFHTIEGGAIIFRKKENFERANKIINFGLEPNGKIRKVGINAKLNEYQCAVGLTLLDSIDNILSHRVELFNLYKIHLSDYVQFPIWHESASYNGAYFPIILENEENKKRIKKALQNSGIPSREYFSPSLNKIFNPNDECPISEDISSRVLCLPIHFYLTTNQVLKIVDVIKKEKQ